jgi:heptosyltransferase-2
VPANILIVRFSSIGDIILTTPVVRAIRARHPDARITFVVRDDFAELVTHNPRIDEVVRWPHRHPLAPLVERLRAGDWTHRLDLHGSLRTWRLRRGVGGRWSGYPKHRVRRTLLIASRRRFGGHLGPVVERYARAARDLDITLDDKPAEVFTSVEAEREAEAFLATRGLGRTRRLVALVPGAAHYTKRWPEGHWSALVCELARTNDVVVLGGSAERGVAERIAAQAGGAAASAAGHGGLLFSAALLRRAAVAAAGDTGLLHLATAVGTPVVALYGPGVEEFGFFPWRAPSRVLQHDLRCRPCSAHGSARCPLGHLNCLRLTTPDAVLAALQRPLR